MRVYTLTISTPDGKPYIVLTEKDNFQIISSIQSYNIGYTDQYTLIEIYNATSLFNKKDLSGYSIVLECGYSQDGISELQGFDTKKIMKKPILKSYIWDIIDDFSSPPENKSIIRCAPIKKNDINKNNKIKDITIIFKKNTYLFDFVKDFMNQYMNASIETNITSIKTISNKTNDISFTYNPNRLDVLKQFNEFIKTFCKNISKLPVVIKSTIDGYELTYDTYAAKPDDVSDELKNIYNSMPQYILDPQCIISPPSFLNPTLIQIQTILLPSIKLGTVVNIKDRVDIRKATAWTFDSMQKISGYWSVQKVSYNISIYDSAPAAFSNIMELTKIEL